MEPTNPYAPTEPTNPYAPPMADVNFVAGDVPSDAEAIRRAHIDHEASIKAFGLLYLLSTVGTALAGVVLLVTGATGDGEAGIALGFGGVLFLLSFVYGWVGLGLRRLDSGVKLGATLLASLGMLSVPIGTIFGAYLLYLIHGAKGKVVLSEEYARVIAATPHVKRQTSVLVWVFVGLLVLLVIAGVVVGVTS